MYRLAAAHFITDRQTDDNIMPVAQSYTVCLRSAINHC